MSVIGDLLDAAAPGEWIAWRAGNRNAAVNIGVHQIPDDAAMAYATLMNIVAGEVWIAEKEGWVRRYKLQKNPARSSGYVDLAGAARRNTATKALTAELRRR